MTEGCRGEGGILVTKMATVICKITAWARKLRWAAEKQIYGTGSTRQSFSGLLAEWRKGNTISTPRGDVVYLDRVTSARKNCMNVCRSSANWQSVRWRRSG